ncbi:barstar family protein [Kitasatospora sp. MBT63]|uniref:barstar family protein n=1 Tax=Kitasatospora sp. MBT63 TaxID=1444768 RepID=UPI0018F56230|nr:barstar family protein [Kitasatospora sp. MBT63]
MAHLSGARMGDAQGVFEEFSRGLNLPAYFGWNWSALSECLRDLSWIDSQSYVILVSDSERLLVEEPDEMDVFLKIMESVGKLRSSTLGSPTTSFNVVLM